MGFRVRNDKLITCVNEIREAIDRGDRQQWLACINPHSYVVAQRRTKFQAALRAADWLIPDGAGIVIGSRILGGRIRQRVTGPDFFYALHDLLQVGGKYSVFFLGSTDEALSEICRRMKNDWPNIRIAGTYSPPFKPEFSDAEIDAMVAQVNSAQPDVLWVGMTAPKQEEWVYRALPGLQVPFTAAVGAVFDFYAGNVKRSHPLFGRVGLEWLPRLLREPRRLWRRTLISAPIFFWHVLLARLGALRPAR